MKLLFTLLFSVLVVAADAAKTSAIIESSHTHLQVSSRNHLTVHEVVRIKILDEDGYWHAIYRDYYNAFRKVKKVQYTVFDAHGKRVKRFTKSDALDVMINSSYEIADVRMLVIDPAYKNFPFTVEMDVEVSYSEFLNFPLWMPRYAHALEVKKATLVLEHFKGFEYKSRELNGVSAPQFSQNEESTTATWTMADLPAVERYENYKAFLTQAGKVHITPVSFTFGGIEGDFKSWGNFGEWFRILNEGRNTLSASTKVHLDGLKETHGENTSALVKAVYQHMQSRTRYISIQLGIGGFQAIPADEVDEKGYGDCKALTNYMKAMLEYLGIPSNYILVYAGGDAPDIQYDFPSNQFNHLFLGVPLVSDTLWFECTSQTLPPAHIGTFTDDRHVLWIDKNNSQVIRTPSFQANESVLKQKCTVTLSPQGDAVLNLDVNQTGMFFDDAMMFQLAKKDYIEKSSAKKFAYPDFTIREYDFKIPDPQQASLNVHYTIDVNAIGKPLGTKMMIPANLLTPMEKNLEVDVFNKYCEVRRPFTLDDHVVLVLPENYRLDVAPETVYESSPYGSYEIRIEQGEDDTVHIYRKVVIQKGTYTKEKFDAFYSAIKKIRQLEQSKIILQSKT